MAKLPQRHAGRLATPAPTFAFAAAPVRMRAFALTIAVGLVAASFAGAARADAGGSPAVDLVGTWHLLVHYTDDHSHDPSQMRWDDKIWVFERAGSRLKWTQYPIVVFEDKTGRFENLGGARAARVVHGWEPNEGQRAQIEGGLEVNPRGSTSETLRAEADGSWRSGTRPASASARVITYVQNWAIESPTTRPVFRREDLLGSAAAEGYDGVTLFTTQEVDAGGNVLRGTFERDGSRHGTFRLTRTGATTDVKGSGKSEGQRFFEAFLGADFAQKLRQIEESEVTTDAERAAVRSEIRTVIEGLIGERDVDPVEYEREMESLTRQITRMLIDEGRSADEIIEMVVEGKINP